MHSKRCCWGYSLLAATAMGVAWWFPGTPACALIGWVAALLLVLTARISGGSFRVLYGCGVVTYSLGFYWLYNTIGDFGGFPFIAALPIFLLFIFGSAIQYLVFALVFRTLPERVDRMALRAPMAWIAAQYLWIRIFPWEVAHTQIGFSVFAQIADISGTPLITWIMFWCAEALVLVLFQKAPRTVAYLPLMSMLAAILYGTNRLIEYRSVAGPPLTVAVIQANISLEQKHDITSFAVNRARYAEMSKAFDRANTLIVWPESTITDFVPAKISNARQIDLVPFGNHGAAYLVGSLTYDTRELVYNSSLAIQPDGSVIAPYHKQILMPFGEYTPGSSIFPWLRAINATAANFTPGSSVSVFGFDFDGRKVGVSPLICYEDVIGSLSRAAVQQGAELLVNQTNDAWFGDTVAPYQHHMIASFRAIENRRYLVRSTNTGLTAVVDPTGNTIDLIPPYSEGTLQVSVTPLTNFSLYTRMLGDWLWWGIALVGTCITLFKVVPWSRR